MGPLCAAVCGLDWAEEFLLEAVRRGPPPGLPDNRAGLETDNALLTGSLDRVPGGRDEGSAATGAPRSSPSMIDWGLGQYEETAAELEPVSARVVALAGLQPGER